MSDIPASVIQYAFFVVLAVVVAVAALWRKRVADRGQDGPLLSSEDMLGMGMRGLQSLSQGAIDGFQYDLMTNDAGRVMLLVQLGHDTWSHVVAYGDKSRMSGVTRALISKRWLEPAVLEGDFPDYFHMYCNPELQDAVRELFTPDIMEEFVDFCRSYDFELFHETLYVSKAENAEDKDNQTTLVGDVTQLLNKQGAVLRRITP